ncbi:MAG: endonuclease III [Ignavibacteriales bacterium]|nr:endonuclease III [Ignavibacteriales bacterium]
MKTQKEFIIRTNSLLIKHFGIPKRNKKLPDPLDMLIATILSQNTNDNNSYKAYRNLKSRYKSWNELYDEKRTTVEKIIRVAGLARAKSTAIKNVISQLNRSTGKISLDHIKKFSSEDAINELTKYKGIGVKTASCVLLFALDRNVCPVDTHVHRTTNRIGIVSEKTPDKTFFALNKNFPERIAHSFHTNLIRLGREICKPTNPNCGICPLLKICCYPDKNFDLKKEGSKRDFMLLDNVNK